jgi:hypothetical protein
VARVGEQQIQELAGFKNAPDPATQQIIPGCGSWYKLFSISATKNLEQVHLKLFNAYRRILGK